MHRQSILTAAAALLSGANAFWRMPCHGRTGLARIDPIVDPGEISGHAHAVHGGGNFGMNSTYDDLLASDCTSCGVYQDKSAYWTPALLFMYPNGTTVAVPQVGGMLAYYLLYGDNIQAFPAEFRLIAGDSRQRNFTWRVPDPAKPWSGDMASQFSLAQHALGFNCLNYQTAPEASLYRHFMPPKDYLDAHCTDGIRLELMFPSCWNGKDVDSPDHKSHMAYPDQVMTGNCPDGFSTRLPSLFFETIWNTYAFNGVDGQFVISNGDPTGFGYHGDFMMGWDVGFLQSAVDTCTNLSGEISDCPLFSLQPDSSATTCSFPVPSALQSDDCAGPRQGICGGVPIQSGPAYATDPASNNADGAAPAQPPVALPTAPPAAPPADAASVLPNSLGYSAGNLVATDNSGGAVTIAAAPPPAAKVALPTTPAVESIAAVAELPSSAPPPPAPPAAPAVTPPAPVAAAVVDPGVPHPVETSTWLEGNTAYVMEVDEVDVTTTVTVGAGGAVKRKRHAHAHAHAHQHQHRKRHGGFFRG